MRKLRSLLKRVRIKYRRSSTLTKTVVMFAIAISMAALLSMQIAYEAKVKFTEEQRQQAAQLEQENNDLNNKIDKQGTMEGVEDAAKDELNMTHTDAVVIGPEE